jgi:hypothetical protein
MRTISEGGCTADAVETAEGSSRGRDTERVADD